MSVQVYQASARGFGIAISPEVAADCKATIEAVTAFDDILDSPADPYPLETHAENLAAIVNGEIEDLTHPRLGAYALRFNIWPELKKGDHVQHLEEIANISVAKKSADEPDELLDLLLQEGAHIGGMLHIYHDNPRVSAFNRFMESGGSCLMLTDTFFDWKNDYAHGLVGSRPSLEGRLKLARKTIPPLRGMIEATKEVWDLVELQSASYEAAYGIGQYVQQLFRDSSNIIGRDPTTPKLNQNPSLYRTIAQRALQKLAPQTQDANTTTAVA